MKIRSIIALILAAIMCFAMIACTATPSTDNGPNGTQNDNNNDDTPGGNTDDETPAENGEVKIKFLKVGKSPSVVIRTENKTIVIDAASEDQGADIVEYLTEKKITTVDYLIITNYSKSCIGGVPTLLRASGITVKAIYQPSYLKQSSAYTSYKNAVAAAAITPTTITADTVITADELTIKFFTPSKDYGTLADENDECNSVVLSLEHKDVKFLYTSRIAGQRVAEVVSQIGDTKYNLITAPNYGIYDATYDAFFTKTGAKHAVIFASTKNPPEAKTITALESAGIAYFVTRDGGVEVRSDGTDMTIKQ